MHFSPFFRRALARRGREEGAGGELCRTGDRKKGLAAGVAAGGRGKRRGEWAKLVGKASLPTHWPSLLEKRRYRRTGRGCPIGGGALACAIAVSRWLGLCHRRCHLLAHLGRGRDLPLLHTQKVVPHLRERLTAMGCVARQMGGRCCFFSG